MNREHQSRMGFTIIELLVVAVLGTLLLMAAYQVLNTNQRTYAVQSERIRGQQTMRAAMEVLTAEFRELSPAEGDIVDLASSGIEIEIPRNFGLVCEVTYGSSGLLGILSSDPELKVVKYGNWFAQGDRVVIFADNDTDSSDDDVWITADVTAADTTSSCGARPAQVLTFGGQQSLFEADTVRMGAPMRSRVPVQFGLSENGTLWRASGGESSDLVGPMALELSYFDEMGNTTTIGSHVAQIEIKLKTSSEIRTSGGQQVQDSLVARVYPRN